MLLLEEIIIIISTAGFSFLFIYSFIYLFFSIYLYIYLYKNLFVFFFLWTYKRETDSQKMTSILSLLFPKLAFIWSMADILHSTFVILAN